MSDGCCFASSFARSASSCGPRSRGGVFWRSRARFVASVRTTDEPRLGAVAAEDRERADLARPVVGARRQVPGEAVARERAAVDHAPRRLVALERHAVERERDRLGPCGGCGTHGSGGCQPDLRRRRAMRRGRRPPPAWPARPPAAWTTVTWPFAPRTSPDSMRRPSVPPSARSTAAAAPVRLGGFADRHGEHVGGCALGGGGRGGDSHAGLRWGKMRTPHSKEPTWTPRSRSPRATSPAAGTTSLADVPTPPQPPLHPGTGQPVGPGRPGAALPDGPDPPGGLDRSRDRRSPRRCSTSFGSGGRRRFTAPAGSSRRSAPARASTTSTRAARRPARTSRTRPSPRRTTRPRPAASGLRPRPARASGGAPSRSRRRCSGSSARSTWCASATTRSRTGG